MVGRYLGQDGLGDKGLKENLEALVLTTVTLDKGPGLQRASCLLKDSRQCLHVSVQSVLGKCTLMLIR